MFHRSFLAVVALYALSSAACTMDDASRCPSGFFYMEDLYACCNAETHEANEVGTKCIPVPEDGGADDAGGPTGVGASCTSDADCTGYDATLCNPFPGECTIEGCDLTPCPDGYTCCGPCSVSQGKLACISDDLVSAAVGMGCPCNSE